MRKLFDHVWRDGGLIVAISPREPFARYFAATARGRRGEAEAPAHLRFERESRKTTVETKVLEPSD